MVLPATGVTRMKKILALLALLIALPAAASEGPQEAPANWASSLFGFTAKAPTVPIPIGREAVAKLVAQRASEKLGPQWVDSALRLAKLESTFNCRATGPKTRHGRAKGVLQVMDGSARALGFDPKRLYECDYGIQAGLAHMQMCIKHGVKTSSDMARCHVSGWGGWNKRLSSKRAENYRQKYVKLSMR
jgi:soluble lytic murein transglycosylase-like protein